MHTTPNGVLTMIPLQIYGIPVGCARISPGGSIEVITGGGNALGKEMKKKLENGLAKGLKIELIDDVTSV